MEGGCGGRAEIQGMAEIRPLWRPLLLSPWHQGAGRSVGGECGGGQELVQSARRDSAGLGEDGGVTWEGSILAWRRRALKRWRRKKKDGGGLRV